MRNSKSIHAAAACLALICSVAVADDEKPKPTDVQVAEAGPFAGRQSPERVRDLLARYGGTPECAAAVAKGLDWLAREQRADGSWTLEGGLAEAANSATGLALLPFLGAGHTHQEGKYKETVQKGLDYLVKRLKELDAGASLADRGTMYGHAIATIAVCEAYGLTKDEKLKGPAQRLVNFIVHAQDPAGGGWRYSPRQPGDTSVTGWQIAALKTAETAGLEVPAAAFKSAMSYLDTVQNDGGYGYTAPMATPGMTASALLSRITLGWKAKSPTVDKSIDLLSSRGPLLTNLYYDYFATQALFHTGGEAWDKWNDKLLPTLVAAQELKGDQAGSWPADKDTFGASTGRIYATSLSLLMLEVYYRHPPLARP